MLKLLSISAIFLISVSAVKAAERLVTTGEHEGFTRLVIHLDGQQDWTFKQEGTEVAITLPSDGIGFDLTQVFDRISKARIHEITQSSNTLKISTHCACKFVAHQTQDNLIVFDFTDIPIASTAPRPSPHPAVFVPNAPPALPASVMSPTGVDPTILLGPELTPPQSTDHARRLLLSEIVQHDALGLIDANAQPISPRDSSPPAIQNMLVRNGFSPTFLAQQSRLSAPQSINARCPTTGPHDPATWRNFESFYDGVSSYHRQLATNEGRLSLAATLDLAEHYLSYGMFAEAAQLTRLFPKAHENRRLETLNTLAHFQKSAHHAATLATFSQCTSPVGVWGFLAEQDIARLRGAPKRELINEFRQFPINLQNVLLDQFIEKLERSGDTELAQNIQATTTAKPSEPSLRQLQTLAQDVSNSTPASALLASIDTKSAPLSPDQNVDLVDGLAFEFRGTDSAEILHQSSLLAQSRAGQFATAYAGLEEISDSTDRTQIARQIDSDLLAIADDATFLTVTLTRHLNDSPLATSLTEQSRSRLLALGFPTLADRIHPISNAVENQPKLIEQTTPTIEATTSGVGLNAARKLLEATSQRREIWDRKLKTLADGNLP